MVLSPRRGVLIIRRGKGLKHREVPLIQDVRDALQPYLARRRTLAEHWRTKAASRGQAAPAWARWPDGHLFLGQRGPLTERGIRDIVAQVGVAAKLDEPLHPHALRHTFATRKAEKGVSPFQLKDWLGHANLNTTHIYVHMAKQNARKVMEATSL